MLDYRLFYIDRRGTIRSLSEFYAPHDAAAVDKARHLFAARPDAHGAELWREAVKMIELSRGPSPTA